MALEANQAAKDFILPDTDPPSQSRQGLVASARHSPTDRDYAASSTAGDHRERAACGYGDLTRHCPRDSANSRLVASDPPLKAGIQAPRPLSCRLRLLHLQEQTFLVVPPKDRS